MFDKFWSSIESKQQPSFHAEILAKTYMNPKSEVLKDIPQFFDKWDISDFEMIVEEVLSMPPLEGESWYPESFGEIGISPELTFNEGYNLSILPDVVWSYTAKNKVKKKKKFF